MHGNKLTTVGAEVGDFMGLVEGDRVGADATGALVRLAEVTGKSVGLVMVSHSSQATLHTTKALVPSVLSHPQR